MTKQQEDDIISAMYGHIDELFPNMKWERSGDKWISSFHLDGNEDRQKTKGTSAILANAKHVVTDIARSDSKEIIKYFAEENNMSRYDAINKICRICHIDPPQCDEKEEKERQERKKKTSNLVELMKKETSSTNGANVRGYLTTARSGGGRGWTEDFVSWLIQEGRIGLMTLNLAQAIEGATGGQFKRMKVNGQWRNVWETHHLTIPTYDKEGNVVYAKTRTIDPNVKGGREKWNNLSSEIGHLFNFNNANALTPGNNSKKLIIMESELCVLHAEFAKIDNCVALQGSGGIKAKEIGAITNARFTKVVILLDNDQVGQLTDEEKAKKKDETSRKTRLLVNAIRKGCGETNKLHILVATIPSEYECKDPDDLLSTHPTDGGQILQSIIDNAISASRWEALLIANKYNDARNDSERMDVKDELIQYGSLLTDIERKEYNETFIQETKTAITEEDLRHAEETKEDEEASRLYAIEVQNASDRLQKALQTGDNDSIDQAKRDIEQLHRPTNAIDIEITSRSMQDQIEELTEDFGEDLETEYCFHVKKKSKDGCKYERIPLIFRSGQLTYIGGGQGHGKTSILQSFAYYLASKHYAREFTQDKRMKVIYYGFEELKKDSVFEFINIHIHAQPEGSLLSDLSPKGNTTAISDYLKGKANAEESFSSISDEKRGFVVDAIKTFFEDYRGAIKDDGSRSESNLYIYDKTMTSKQLVEHARKVSRTIHPNAIVIDYVQFINSGNPKAQTWEDTALVSRDILNLAKELKVPIILGAQLNRDNQALTPGTMEKRHLANSSAIEKDGNTLVLIFNSKEEDGRVNYFGKHAEETQGGINLGEEGYMFLKIVKNRGGKSPGMGVYSYDGGQRFLSYDNLVSPETIEEENASNFNGIISTKKRK